MKLEIDKEITKKAKINHSNRVREKVYAKEKIDRDLIVRQVASVNNKEIVRVQEVINSVDDFLISNMKKGNNVIMIPFFGKFIFKPILKMIREDKKQATLMRKLNKQ